MLDPAKTKRTVLDLFQAKGRPRKAALVPQPLGGSLPAAVPSAADRRRAQEVQGNEDEQLLHLDDKRFLAYGIIAGRPIGPLSSHMPQTNKEQLEAQEEARRERARRSEKSLVMEIDTKNG